jgi:hypothetical protein
MTLDPSNPRDAVIVAGRDRLLVHALDGLRAQLNASTLSRESPVSRDTAYRVFRGDPGGGTVTDRIVAAVAEAANDTAWGGYDLVLNQILANFAASIQSGSDPTNTMIEAFGAAFDGQFLSPGFPVGWILQACALTASSAWQGEPPASQDDLDLGRKLLDARRDYYEWVTDRLVAFFTVALSEHGRRPRPGLDPRPIVALMHALCDGAVLRRTIEPEAFSTELVAEAMYLLWMVLTEQGPAQDPRKPEDERSQQLFDRLVAAGGELWQERPDITVDDAAKAASVPPEAATLLFPDIGDLADSFIRAQVVGGGFPDLGPVPDPSEARQRLPALVAELRRLRDLADSNPHAVAATRDHHPTRSKPFVEDFIGTEARLVDALDATAQSDQLVRDLVSFACQGTPGWASVVALLRTINVEAD